MRTQFVVAVLAGLSIGLALSQLSVPLPVQSQEGKGTTKSGGNSELDRLKASAEVFGKAYNAGDAKSLAAQFTSPEERNAVMAILNDLLFSDGRVVAKESSYLAIIKKVLES